MSDLRRLLLDTAAVYADLEDALHGVRTGDPGGPRGTKVEAPLPLAAEVADHRHLLLRGLRYWAGKVGATPRVLAQGGVSHLTAWVVSQLDTLDAEERTELRTNLLDWQRGARGRMDLPKLRGSIPLPGVTCPDRAEVDGAEVYACAGALRIVLPADKDTAPWLSCSTCRTRYAVTDLPAAADVRLPVHVAAELLDVSVRTIQRRTEAREDGMVRLGDVVRTDCAL